MKIITGGEELLVGLQNKFMSTITQFFFKPHKGEINRTMPGFIVCIIILPMMWVLTHGYQSESLNRVSSVLITSE